MIEIFSLHPNSRLACDTSSVMLITDQTMALNIIPWLQLTSVSPAVINLETIPSTQACKVVESLESGLQLPEDESFISCIPYMKQDIRDTIRQAETVQKTNENCELVNSRKQHAQKSGCC